MNRGRLRIYLGYAPGAGTTCALLSEAHQRAEHGTDVVVAITETHGRPYTETLLAGLEIIPPAKVPYQGTRFEEIDVGAVLARRPAVALVDDLAHGNVPGAGHARRRTPLSWCSARPVALGWLRCGPPPRSGHS